ncbi:hypothetical protein EV421DRAFT_1739269 [Armillaria borealis]|uniref:Uncharacterized protein n=1 Tax=Armillaria borealis TaxID=47425 RepID=A0AA39MKI8_9AGAR|nr:hypothetical protein EV421DRAFT_1739269 [Armillaria borealis]
MVQQLDEDVLGLIFNAACRGDTGMVAILGSICRQFRRLVVRITDETVIINDYVLDDPGPATTPEMALKVFGDGGDERKRQRAHSLKWKAYNVRLDVFTQVLGTLERVTVLTFIGAKLDERADVILRLPKIHELFFDHCTLGFPGLASLMQALPNLEALRTLGPGKVISQTTPFFPDTEPPLTLPTSLEYLDVDCTHMSGHWGFDDGECILYWLNNAKNLVGGSRLVAQKSPDPGELKIPSLSLAGIRTPQAMLELLPQSGSSRAVGVDGISMKRIRRSVLHL